jgi:hypothetical protein
MNKLEAHQALHVKTAFLEEVAVKRKVLMAGILLAVSAVAMAKTVQVEVDGLNCALCSEEMKTKLKTVAHADKVVPRLECGRIYFGLSAGEKLDESGLRSTLLQSGFVMGSVSDVPGTIDVVGAAKC